MPIGYGNILAGNLGLRPPMPPGGAEPPSGVGPPLPPQGSGGFPAGSMPPFRMGGSYGFPPWLQDRINAFNQMHSGAGSGSAVGPGGVPAAGTLNYPGAGKGYQAGGLGGGGVNPRLWNVNYPGGPPPGGGGGPTGPPVQPPPTGPPDWQSYWEQWYRQRQPYADW